MIGEAGEIGALGGSMKANEIREGKTEWDKWERDDRDVAWRWAVMYFRVDSNQIRYGTSLDTMSATLADLNDLPMQQKAEILQKECKYNTKVILTLICLPIFNVRKC